MLAYLVTDVTTQRTRIVDFSTAARLAGLDPAELEYALDEQGLCETDRYTVVDVLADKTAAG